MSANDGRNRYRPEDIRAIPVRSYGSSVAALLVLVFLALLIRAIAANKNIQWSQVEHFQWSSAILGGFAVTMELTVICQTLGVALGIVLAVMRLSRNRVLSALGWFYVWFVRGTPVLVQLVFWFNLGILFPTIGIGGLSLSTNQLITSFTAAVLGLGLNEAAYMAEIVRAGILSVDEGQTEASLALGFSPLQTLRHVVLPQAMRVVVPPTGNQLISLLKTTSLVAFIAGGDLLTVAQNIYSKNFLVIELLIVVSIWYLAATSVANIVQFFIERHFGRGIQPAAARRM